MVDQGRRIGELGGENGKKEVRKASLSPAIFVRRYLPFFK